MNIVDNLQTITCLLLLLNIIIVDRTLTKRIDTIEEELNNLKLNNNHDDLK